MVLHRGVFKGRRVNELRDLQQHLLVWLGGTELSAEIREGEMTSEAFWTALPKHHH
jgi:hypothetical protein